MAGVTIVRNRRRLHGTALLAGLVLIAASCGSDDDDANNTAPSVTTQSTASGAPTGTDGAPESGLSVGNAIGGPRNDQAYFQSEYEGTSEGARRNGLEYAFIDNLLGDEAAATDAIRNLAAEHPLVVADITLVGPALAIAEQSPDTAFIVPSGYFKPGEVPDNVHGYAIVYGPAIYPIGLAAGTLTSTKKIGWLTGLSFPIERTGLAAFTAAAQSIDPSIEVVETVISSTSDIAAAKAAAAAMIDSDVDVIYGFLDAGFEGLVQAVEESGKDVKITAFDTSGSGSRCDSSDQVVAVNNVSVEAMLSGAVDDFVNGDLAGPTRAFGIDDTKVQNFELCGNWQSPELVELTDAAVQGITAGTLELPANVTAP